MQITIFGLLCNFKYSDSGVNTGWARWANATGLGTEGGPSPTYNTYTIAHWLFLYSSFDSKFHKNRYIILISEKNTRKYGPYIGTICRYMAYMLINNNILLEARFGKKILSTTYLISGTTGTNGLLTQWLKIKWENKVIKPTTTILLYHSFSSVALCATNYNDSFTLISIMYTLTNIKISSKL